VGAEHNAYTLAADFDDLGHYAQGRADRATRHHAMLLETRIKAHASGRPGPRAPTGDYRRSWTTRHYGGASTVATNKPQARRLEFGFQGPDRLGRVYNQPPYPHVGPAVDETVPGYQADLSDIIAEL
jgi:hypothetical protein